MSRPTQVTIDLAAVAHNYRLASQLAPQSQTMAVVKADGYGHGMGQVAHALKDFAPAFAVSSIDEAFQLKQSGIQQPILLLEGFFHPGEIAEAHQNNFWAVVHNEQQIHWLEEYRPDIDTPMSIWLKFDTGMHRLGLPVQSAKRLTEHCRRLDWVREDITLMTHFSEAEDPSQTTLSKQLALCEQHLKPLSLPQSYANSAAMLSNPKTCQQWARPGIMLYGASPCDDHAISAQLRPAMTLSSEVIAVREVEAGESVGYGGTWIASEPTTIATVTVGYGDGYPRQAPSGTPVLINGREFPIAGRVSMDMLTVDVGHESGVEVGNRVELWGKQLPIKRIAEHAQSISYELMTRMPKRPNRVYQP